MQCACTSMVLTRLPLTTTSRRRACGGAPGAGVTLVIAQPMNAMPAMALLNRSPLIGICVPPPCFVGQLANMSPTIVVSPYLRLATEPDGAADHPARVCQRPSRLSPLVSVGPIGATFAGDETANGGRPTSRLSPGSPLPRHHPGVGPGPEMAARRINSAQDPQGRIP